jgi:hypothetical protein
LKIKNPSQVEDRLDEDEKGITYTLGGKQEMIIRKELP